MAASGSVKINFRVFNIVIRSTRPVTPDSYQQLFQRIFKERIWENVSREVAVMFRTQFDTVVGKNQILYGKVVRYTSLDGKTWFDRTNLNEKEVDLPAELFPNLRQSDYVFVPAAHRFALVEKADGVTATNMLKYLQLALNKVAAPDDEVYVHIEQDADAFESIIEATQIKRLVINISYSNNDTTDEVTDFIDQDIRASQVGRMQISVSPDAHGDIVLDNSTVLRGALGVAKSNGNATATVVTEVGERKKVSTTNYPLKLSVKADTEGDGPFAIFAKILSHFRDKPGSTDEPRNA